MNRQVNFFALLVFIYLITPGVSATEPFIQAANIEVVSSSGVTLTEGGETSTLAAGDLLSRSDLAFSGDSELRLRDPATGQIYILSSAADALALAPLWTPPLRRGSTQNTFSGNTGQQTEDPNPQPQSQFEPLPTLGLSPDQPG